MQKDVNGHSWENNMRKIACVAVYYDFFHIYQKLSFSVTVPEPIFYGSLPVNTKLFLSFHTNFPGITGIF